MNNLSPPRPNLTKFPEVVFSNGIPIRALKVSILVGSTLLLTNHWDSLFNEAPANILAMVSCFIIPYFVSSYGAVSMMFTLQNKNTTANNEDKVQFATSKSNEEINKIRGLSQQVFDNATAVNKTLKARSDFALEVSKMSLHASDKLTHIVDVVEDVQSTFEMLKSELLVLSDAINLSAGSENETTTDITNKSRQVSDGIQTVQKAIEDVSSLASEQVKCTKVVSEKVSLMVNDAQAAIKGSAANINVGTSLLDQVQIIEKST